MSNAHIPWQPPLCSHGQSPDACRVCWWLRTRHLLRQPCVSLSWGIDEIRQWEHCPCGDLVVAA